MRFRYRLRTLVIAIALLGLSLGYLVEASRPAPPQRRDPKKDEYHHRTAQRYAEWADWCEGRSMRLEDHAASGHSPCPYCRDLPRPAAELVRENRWLRDAYRRKAEEHKRLSGPAGNVPEGAHACSECSGTMPSGAEHHDFLARFDVERFYWYDGQLRFLGHHSGPRHTQCPACRNLPGPVDGLIRESRRLREEYWCEARENFHLAGSDWQGPTPRVLWGDLDAPPEL